MRSFRKMPVEKNLRCFAKSKSAPLRACAESCTNTMGVCVSVSLLNMENILVFWINR